MGVLGIDSAYYLSDRIFAMLDEDGDNKVNFEEYMRYLDILLNGDQTEKNQWTFRLIDFRRRGFFDYEDFERLISMMVGTWLFLTGNQMNERFEKNIEKMSQKIFSKMDLKQIGRVSLPDFQASLRENPKLLEIYEILNNDITDLFGSSNDKFNERKLLKIMNIVDPLILEIHRNSLSLAASLRNPSIKFPPSNTSNNSMLRNGITLKTCSLTNEQKLGFKPAISSQIEPIRMDSEEDLFGLPGDNPSLLKNTMRSQESERKSGESLDSYFSKRTRSLFYSISNNTMESNLKKKDNFEETIKKCQENNNQILEKLREIKLLAELGNKNNQLIEDYQKKTKDMILQQKIKKTAQNIKKNNEGSQSPQKKLHKRKMIFIGNEKWNFVLNMMLGIQNAVRGVFLMDTYTPSEDDFRLTYSFEIIPSKTLSICYHFSDVAPYVFFALRKKNQITNENYLSSIGVDRFVSDLIQGKVATLSELISSGKSGCFFYYTADGKYTLKTIHKKEFIFFGKILKHYYEYITENQHSFLAKIYGLHKITYKTKDSFKTKNIYFIVMENIFNTDKEIHKTYDLKGSLYKRETEESKEINTPQKDKNAIANRFRINLPKDKLPSFRSQLEKDCDFLCKNGIIDYSFLAGVHDRSTDQQDPEINALISPTIQSDLPTINNVNRIIDSSDNSALYYLGIIDFLTYFDMKKKGEYLVKKLIYGPTISAVPPKHYAKRFRNFICELLQDQ